MWLPAVGALLFLTVGLMWALSAPPKETTDLSGMPATSAAATPTATATVTATAPPAPRQPPPGRPGGPGQGGGHDGHGH